MKDSLPKERAHTPDQLYSQTELLRSLLGKLLLKTNLLEQNPWDMITDYYSALKMKKWHNFTITY